MRRNICNDYEGNKTKGGSDIRQSIMLNHFNFDKFNGKVLITNDLGKYRFLNEDEFSDYVTERLDTKSELYASLKNDYFLLDSKADILNEELVHRIRDMKNYLMEGPSLHIFAVTNICNINCVYCQARDHASESAGYMTLETGCKAIDIALQSPASNLTFEFQGGEPLLNFEVIKGMILYAEAHKQAKKISYTTVSNLLALTDDKIEFLKKYNVSVSTSMDGPKYVHDFNRRAGINKSSFDYMEKGLKKLQDEGISGGAIETTTRYSLNYPKEIVDAYRNHGIAGIFIRPLTPLGFAAEDWARIGYTPKEYLEFYNKALDYIIEINRKGERFPEFLAGYFLEKILGNFAQNYMELRSPCGATMGQLSYYYNGDIYTCDEGRMISEAGKYAFRLGNVYESSYADLIQNPVCKATVIASVIETLPSCSGCVFQPYCGVCPVVTYAMEDDVFPREPHGFRCEIYKGIQKILFTKLMENDEEVLKIFQSWL